MKFLVVVQDLRITGTSEGIVSRSFIAKLRKSYPNAIIDLVYLKSDTSDAQLNLLPVNSIEEHLIDVKIPFMTKWLDKIYWRLCHQSLQNKYIQNVYASYLSKIDYTKYDHIFIRSSGLDYEVILSCKNLPILKHAIINFHDPYPLFWYPGTKQKLTSLELFKIKEMYEVVLQAKTCISPSYLLSNDLAFLFSNRKKFFTLPHQYSNEVFDFSNISNAIRRNKKILISYQGAIMFGRNVEILIDAYLNLIKKESLYKEDTEFVLRVKGDGFDSLRKKYNIYDNVKILYCTDLASSNYEQINEASINVILENGPFYSNILVGKAPFLASTKKPILVLAPERSELRSHVQNAQYLASYDNPSEVEQKLENLIKMCLNSQEFSAPFGDYFSSKNFKIMLDKITSS